MNLLDRWAAHNDQRLELMGRMMQTLQVDVEQVAMARMGGEIRAMMGRCLSCPAADLCERWLAGEERGRSHREFCVNASAFDAYRTA